MAARKRSHVISSDDESDDGTLGALSDGPRSLKRQRIVRPHANPFVLDEADASDNGDGLDVSDEEDARSNVSELIDDSDVDAMEEMGPMLFSNTEEDCTDVSIMVSPLSCPSSATTSSPLSVPFPPITGAWGSGRWCTTADQEGECRACRRQGQGSGGVSDARSLCPLPPQHS